MPTATISELVARNPATNVELGRVPVTPPEQVASIVARAREAQKPWSEAGWPARRAFLKRWWKIVSRDADVWAGTIRDEIGKPRVEALAGDVIGTLDGLRWTVRHGGKALASERIGPGHQRFLQLTSGRMEHRPVGVVGMIGTWNYPLFLNAPPIAQALAAGNAVVWKPSELAALSGLRLQQSLEEAGLPDGLVQAVFGGPEVGRALVDSDIDKGLFTGGVTNGRRVLSALAARGVPAIAELSGFDPAIVLPDAPIEATAKAIAWSAFVGAGQTCVAVKRVYVVGDALPFARALASQARSLRIGVPARDDVDLGPMISEEARSRFHAMVMAAIEHGAERLAGGDPTPGPGWFYPPTVLMGTSIAPETALAGAFGPVVLIRPVADPDTAVAAANASPYGLAASVWSANKRAARELAGRFDVGTVNVNDAVTSTMQSAAPFGGVKASGFGRTHGLLGLREFTQPRVIFTRPAGGFRPHLFPYGVMPVDTVFRLYRRLFH